MSGFTCPYCSRIMTVTTSNYKETFQCFDTSYSSIYDELSAALNAGCYQDLIKISFYECPGCQEVSIYLTGYGQKVKGLSLPIKPQSLAKQFPNYIPKQILDDYKEAYSILYLSPKASATLSRRCLQGMIRDFWGIKEKNLNMEIIKLQDKVSAELWSVLNGVRQLGNIGAHMEKDINVIVDIDPQEAEKLIKLIELLINDWYVARHNQEKLYSDIIGINQEKQIIRNPKE